MHAFKTRKNIHEQPIEFAHLEKPNPVLTSPLQITKDQIQITKMLTDSFLLQCFLAIRQNQGSRYSDQIENPESIQDEPNQESIQDEPNQESIQDEPNQESIQDEPNQELNQYNNYNQETNDDYNQDINYNQEISIENNQEIIDQQNQQEFLTNENNQIPLIQRAPLAEGKVYCELCGGQYKIGQGIGVHLASCRNKPERHLPNYE